MQIPARPVDTFQTGSRLIILLKLCLARGRLFMPVLGVFRPARQHSMGTWHVVGGRHATLHHRVPATN